MIEHYIVFVGAGAPLASEIRSLEKRIDKSCVIAPAVKKGQTGNTRIAVRRSSEELYDKLKMDRFPSQRARLYVWIYEPTDPNGFEFVLSEYGHASWVEIVPLTYLHRIKPTRDYLENRLNEVRAMLHEMSRSICGERKSSPLTLPLRNFKSDLTQDLRGRWYNGLNQRQLSDQIEKFKIRYKRMKNRSLRGYRDDRSLIFKPAEDGECHGKPHPAGTDRTGQKTFFCGRFRYGVSLFPGFHFDVSAEKGSAIQCDLRSHTGETRRMSSERRRHVNIFPNDYILPKNKSGV